MPVCTLTQCLCHLCHTRLSTHTFSRQATLTLHNVELFGCSQQAILLEGPSAKLVVTDSTLHSHTSSSSSATGGSNAQQHGVVLTATQQASVEFTRVTLRDNTGPLQPGSANFAPRFTPECNVTSNVDDAGLLLIKGDGPPCGAPVLQSSLISLQQSTLTLSASSILNNTADAIIAAAGAGPQAAVKLLQGSVLRDNAATWLLVADSFAHDKVGRQILLAPHPEPPNALRAATTPPPRFHIAYTTDAFIGRVRGNIADANGTVVSLTSSKAGVAQVEKLVGVAPKGQVRKR